VQIDATSAALARVTAKAGWTLLARSAKSLTASDSATEARSEEAGSSSGERRDGKLLLAVDLERGAAGGQEMNARIVGDELSNAWRSLKDVLEVIQDEQEVLPVQEPLQLTCQCRLAPLDESQRVGDRRKDQVGPS